MDIIITIICVAVFGALAGWSLYRKLTGKSSGCGGCGTGCCQGGGSDADGPTCAPDDSAKKNR